MLEGMFYTGTIASFNKKASKEDASKFFHSLTLVIPGYNIVLGISQEMFEVMKAKIPVDSLVTLPIAQRVNQGNSKDWKPYAIVNFFIREDFVNLDKILVK